MVRTHLRKKKKGIVSSNVPECRRGGGGFVGCFFCGTKKEKRLTFLERSG